MLARVLKKTEDIAVAPLSLPEIGEPNEQNKGINAFVVPDISAFEIIENPPETQIIENEPDFVPLDAEDILQQAREEAARMIAQAEEQSQIIAQVAQEKAEQEARAKFEDEVAGRVSDLRLQLAETIAQVSALTDDVTSRIEPQVVELALHIAKKIVGREVTIDREIALTLVRVSLGKLHNRSIAEVHLNPEDFNFVETHRERLDFRGALELVEDKSVSIGGCLIHTETGDIDARIESQFDEIAQGLF